MIMTPTQHPDRPIQGHVIGHVACAFGHSPYLVPSPFQARLGSCVCCEHNALSVNLICMISPGSFMILDTFQLHFLDMASIMWRKGMIFVHFSYATVFIHIVNLITNEENDLSVTSFLR